MFIDIFVREWVKMQLGSVKRCDEFIMEILVVLFILLCGVTCTWSAEVTVTTPVGVIVGVRENFTFAGQNFTIRKFLGIAYAESPVDERRFSKPVKKAPFTEDYIATSPRMSCIQNTKMFPGLDSIPSDEDCLNLNIYVPDTASVNDTKTVMVFIYGGSFQIGSQDTYAAEALPVLNDVILVTLNYRVNLFGFLASEKHGLPGNYGLWDQHLAIRWIHENIASFGGDPSHVTLFGESAGGASVMYQAMYEGNKGLFNRVILQSGIVGAYWSFTGDPEQRFNLMKKDIGCERDTVDEVLSCLRSADTDFGPAYSASAAVKDMYLPAYDGDFIKYNPADLYNMDNPSSMEALGNFADIDVIVGFNSHEGFIDMRIIGEISDIDTDSLDNGLNMEDFYAYYNNFNSLANISSKSPVETSIIHEYTDWAKPDDDIARRTNTLDLISDTGFQIPAILASNAHASISTNQNTYVYRFEHRPSYSANPEWITGADHGQELTYVFGFPPILMYLEGVYSEDPGLTLPTNEVELSKSMMQFWAQFAKFGCVNFVNYYLLLS